MTNIDHKLTLGTASEFVDPGRQVKLLPDIHTRIQAYEELRGGVIATLPEFWPPVEIGIAAMATLLISSNSQPTAIIFEGPSGTGKTSVARILDNHPVSYRSDDFSDKAWLTHHQPKGREGKPDDPNRHLINRIRYKTLLTPEMGSFFAGDEEKIKSKLAITTRVLDGHGLTTDKGTLGQLNYTGDYLFSWIGCSTPLAPSAWAGIDKLGARFLFWEFKKHTVTIEDLLEERRKGSSFRSKVEECARLVKHYLPTLFGPTDMSAKARVRKLDWNSPGDAEDISTWVFSLADLAAATRGLDPARFVEVFMNLAMTLSYMRGFDQLSSSVVSTLTYLAFSSMPERDRAIVTALVQGDGEATGTRVAELIGKHKTTVSGWDPESLNGMNLIYSREAGQSFVLCDNWRWLLDLRPFVDGAK